MALGNHPIFSVVIFSVGKDDNRQFIMWPEELLWEKYVVDIFEFSFLSVSSARRSVLFMLHEALKPSTRASEVLFKK